METKTETECETKKREKKEKQIVENKNGCDPLKDYFVLCTKKSLKVKKREKNWKRMPE